MKRHLFALVALAAAAGWVQAQSSDVWLCIGQDGSKEYKNVGTVKGCKKVDLPGITSIPAPARKPIVTASVKANAPADFPKIDGGAQKVRDNDRRQILTDEMKTEEEKLAELKKLFNNGAPERRPDEKDFAKYQQRVASIRDDMERTEKNVEALKREIGNLK